MALTLVPRADADTPAQAPNARAATDIRRDATVQAVEQVMPSVVNIATEEVIEQHDDYDDMLRQFFGWSLPRRQQRVLNLGSGVIISEDGYLLTNFHVVRRARRIQVKLWDSHGNGREYEAENLGGTEHRDVALLKIKAQPGEKFKAVRFAPDDDLLLGETVLALGNPYGLGGSVSKGILSSKTRRPPTEEQTLDFEDWLQTDAAINPGNSGGPLINLRGELIGLNVATVMQAHGISFAIPIKQVSEALAGILTPEATQSLWLGLRLRPGDPGSVVGLAQASSAAGNTGLRTGDQIPQVNPQAAAPAVRAGLAVALVQPGSPAEKAGLRVGDQLLQVNGQPVAGLFAFHRRVKESSNHEVALLVKRGSDERSFKVRMRTFPEMIREKLGLALTEVNSDLAARLGTKAGEGLLVAEVEPDGPADKAQVQRGYMLKGLDGQAAGDIKTVADVLANKKQGDTASLSVEVRRRIAGNFVELRQGTIDVQVR